MDDSGTASAMSMSEELFWLLFEREIPLGTVLEGPLGL